MTVQHKELNSDEGEEEEEEEEVVTLDNSVVSSDAFWINTDGNVSDPRALAWLRRVLTARVYDVACETPLTLTSRLSTRIGGNNKLWLKREDLQPVFSFKCRGAYNRMVQLTQTEREKGVVACSAGNHAQGVALAAKCLGVKSTIVMPTMTPPIKYENVTLLGADILLHGDDFDAAKTECYRLAEERNLTVIHPYDDPYIIGGQGTIGAEILRQMDPSKINVIFCCVGGGGLLSGVASYVKALFPSIKVIGVETFDSDAMTRSLKAGRRVLLKQVGLYADGAAVKLVGKETFKICKQLVDEMVLVSTDEICAAIKDIFEDTRTIVEPAGALGVAGAKKWLTAHGHKDKTVIAISSGANMNFDRLRFVNERAEVGEGREVLMSVMIPERPGSFNKLYSCIHPHSITEFSYRYGDADNAHIFLSFVVKPSSRAEEIAYVLAELDKHGMKGLDISQCEIAKTHVRFMVGGRKDVSNERLYQFTFPERPGALERFLNNLNPQWNVSLFHYRNTGGDVGKVLLAIQVPAETEAEWKAFVEVLQYPCIEETESEVYQRFLKGSGM